MRLLALFAAVGTVLATAQPAAANGAVLPGFFAESWAVVSAQPLLRLVPSRGKSARLPIRGRLPVAGVSVQADWPAHASDAPPLRQAVMAYADPARQIDVSRAVADIPFPLARPEDIPAEPPRTETKVAMLGGPVAGVAIGNLVKMAALDPVGKGGCHVEQPFKVVAAGQGAMDLSPAATLNEKMANRVGQWAREVEDAARVHLGQPISAIIVAASYDCRTQNHRRRARLSEHARANAIDVAGFRLADGQKVTIAEHWKGAGARSDFLRAVHKESCALFQVVLGPGSDGMHENHLHMDLGRWKACR